MKAVYCFFFLVFSVTASSQNVSDRLGQAWMKFESDSQLRTAISSIYVVNAKTGEVVFERNGKTGLATASTLKVITAASVYEFLGKNFRYQTQFGKVDIGKGKILLRIYSSGDPALGSWRWANNNRFNVMNRLTGAVLATKSKVIGIQHFDPYHDSESIPGGWIWEDIGNYYGAGAEGLNWHENQFDVVLASQDSLRTPVRIIKTNPVLYHYALQSAVYAAEKGTGDNAYIYFPVGRTTGIIRGTIPVQEKNFLISGAMPNAAEEFIGKLSDTLRSLKHYAPDEALVRKELIKMHAVTVSVIHREFSPTLDSMIYWFLKKSINLYGEAFVKTVALKTSGTGFTDKGVDTIISYWKQKGIDPAELRIVDGSGLSPLNRVTTRAQVQVLQYARSQSWFKGFYDAFPEYNGMKIKSGTINGVKGFCGYHKAKDGNEYIFSFLVNNYVGSASGLVNKMYKVLDELK
jgi:serine-type D-Ala-D-Ala carboxypeptidase/endopeptidase (penicillin-binding protein 4)